MAEGTVETPIEEEYPDLTALFQESPLAYAGYRISELKKRGSGISEAGEVPFVTSPVFPFVLAAYVLYTRVMYAFRRASGRTRVDGISGDVHVFSMTSSHGYRTRSFLEVARELQERGVEVLLLCSPAAAEKRSSWEREELPTTTHRELHGHVGPLALVRDMVATGVLTARLWRHEDTERSLTSGYQYYNFILLEHVKRESMRALTADDPSIHTFSAMPYLVDATVPEKLFAYQHGLQMANYDRCLSLPFFTPMQLFIWGEAWRERFERALHSDSTVHVVGSPWYDYLASRRDDRERRHDVLFIGGSHGLTDPEVTAQYERLLGTTVETCEREGYSLAIKLHPLESAEWYERRDWGEYVEPFDDIDDALLSTRVAVTNTSTAFVESAVLSVPVVVADLFEKGLADLAPVDHIRFTEGPDVGAAIRSAVEGDEFRSEGSRPLVVLGDSRSRIVEQVLDRSREHGVDEVLDQSGQSRPEQSS
jgi:hypothetical protein